MIQLSDYPTSRLILGAVFFFIFGLVSVHKLVNLEREATRLYNLKLSWMKKSTGNREGLQKTKMALLVFYGGIFILSVASVVYHCLVLWIRFN